MREPHKNRAEGSPLRATASAAGLGDLPLGSLPSRAAARSLIDARVESDEEAMLVSVFSVGNTVDPRKCHCKAGRAGRGVCRCFLWEATADGSWNFGARGVGA
jgi:hypothetical protein